MAAIRGRTGEQELLMRSHLSAIVSGKNDWVSGEWAVVSCEYRDAHSPLTHHSPDLSHKHLTMTKKQRYEHVLNFFQEHIPDAETELIYDNPFQLLVAVILSAQCTDKRVNLTTPYLPRISHAAKNGGCNVLMIFFL
jgi:hypothetical protein